MLLHQRRRRGGRAAGDRTRRGRTRRPREAAAGPPQPRARRGKLGIPGGFVDPGESAEAAARRELREELRLELPPAPLRFLCTAANAYPYRGVLYRTLDTVFTAPLPALPAWFDEAEIGALVPTDPFAVADADLAFPAIRTALAAWRA